MIKANPQAVSGLIALSDYSYFMNLISLIQAFFTAVIVLLLTMPVSYAAVQEITIYSYQSEPPYALDDKELGMSNAFVSAFNRQSEDIKLVLTPIDRFELNARVSEGQAFVILWANPRWFEALAPDLLRSDVIFSDADVWVSRFDERVMYQQPEDVIGFNIGLRRGYFYDDISLMAEAGEIDVSYYDSHLESYTALRRAVIDAFVISRSTLLYWYTHSSNRSKLYVSESTQDIYTRHILASQDYKPIMPILNRFIEQLKNSQSWQKRLQFWGLNSLFQPFDLELDTTSQVPSQ